MQSVRIIAFALAALPGIAAAEPIAMTADRGEMMERLRREMLAASGPVLDHGRKSDLFYLTSLFERVVWLLRQFALVQQTFARPADTQS